MPGPQKVMPIFGNDIKDVLHSIKAGTRLIVVRRINNPGGMFYWSREVEVSGMPSRRIASDGTVLKDWEVPMRHVTHNGQTICDAIPASIIGLVLPAATGNENAFAAPYTPYNKKIVDDIVSRQDGRAFRRITQRKFADGLVPIFGTIDQVKRRLRPGRKLISVWDTNSGFYYEHLKVTGTPVANNHSWKVDIEHVEGLKVSKHAYLGDYGILPGVSDKCAFTIPYSKDNLAMAKKIVKTKDRTAFRRIIDLKLSKKEGAK